jgi:hypothetical protein
MRVRFNLDGTLVQIFPDGREEPLPLVPITPAEANTRLADDPDNPPLTLEQLKKFKRRLLRVHKN